MTLKGAPPSAGLPFASNEPLSEIALFLVISAVISAGTAVLVLIVVFVVIVIIVVVLIAVIVASVLVLVLVFVVHNITPLNVFGTFVPYLV